MKKKVSKNKPSAKKPAVKKSSCTNPVCKLMTGPKGRAFGKAGAEFYADYLKIAKKEKNAAAIEGLAHALVEMKGMSKGQICACGPECDGENCCGDGSEAHGGCCC